MTRAPLLAQHALEKQVILSDSLLTNLRACSCALKECSTFVRKLSSFPDVLLVGLSLFLNTSLILLVVLCPNFRAVVLDCAMLLYRKEEKSYVLPTWSPVGPISVVCLLLDLKLIATWGGWFAGNFRPKCQCIMGCFRSFQEGPHHVALCINCSGCSCQSSAHHRSPYVSMA